MRILIDLEGAQLAEHHLYTMLFAESIISSAGGHEVIIALNGLLPDYILDIRKRLKHLIADRDIRVWHAIGPVAASYAGNSQRRGWAERIREYFLASLTPDVVIVTDFFAGNSDDAVSSIGRLGISFPTVLLVRASDMQALASEDVSRFVKNKRDMMDMGAGFIPLSGDCEGALMNIWPGHALLPRFPDKLDDKSEADVNRIGRLVVQRLEVLVADWQEEKSRNGKRKRLAMVSPLPPSKTGIADYTADLLPALTTHYDIDLIVGDNEVVDKTIKDCFEIHTASWFRRNANRYDRIVYQFGNSLFHAHIFELAKLFPGVVVLHDFYLSDLRLAMDQACAATPYIDELYNSHGYRPLKDLVGEPNWQRLMAAFPTNRAAFQDAIGVIVHSEFSRVLAREWYGEKTAQNWAVIPLVRTPVDVIDRYASRASLGLSKDDFVVCSLGHIVGSKLNDRILDAWAELQLWKTRRFKLIFVGELSADNYGQELGARIKSISSEQNVHVTGWVEKSEYLTYARAADLAIQLRSKSRGETSAAVLDCMNVALPTIVNANGSMAYLPNDAVRFVADQFEAQDLLNALEEMVADDCKRLLIGDAARRWILENHNPEKCALLYWETIERFYAKAPVAIGSLIESIVEADFVDSAQTIDSSDYSDLVSALSTSMLDKARNSVVYVDISEIVIDDLRTGIQRVVRSLIHEWIKSESLIRVEPVYASDQHGRWNYYHARRWTQRELGLTFETVQDMPVEFQAGDELLLADFTGPLLIELDRAGYYDKLRMWGVRISAIVYDILPVKYPQYFPASATDHARWLNSVGRVADRAFCISMSVANDLNQWFLENLEGEKSPKIQSFRLGADIANSNLTRGVSLEVESTLKMMEGGTSFIAVGTLEPRKMHLQMVEAFDVLWSKGHHCHLVLIGKRGWMVDELETRLIKHKEFGRHLHWLDKVSDESLERLYSNSSCLLAASVDEGFGLPLIEAAQHRIPIIARDIPVFREVAGDHAYYFRGTSGKELASAIISWLKLYKNEEHPKSDALPWLTWAESARLLMDQIVLHDAPVTILPH